MRSQVHVGVIEGTNVVFAIDFQFHDKISAYAKSVSDSTSLSHQQYELRLDRFDISSICEYVFSEMHNISAITLPISISSIPNYAFKNCNNLLSIELPENVVIIGDNAFENCSALQTVVIRAHADVKFGKDVFKNCNALSTIILTKNNSQALEQYYGLSST